METVIHFYSSRAFSVALRIILPVALLALVFHTVSLDDITAAFREAHPLLITAGILMILPAFALRIAAWHQLLNSGTSRAAWSESCASFFVGQAFGFITPGGLGDFVVRGVGVKNVPNTSVIGLTILDNALLLLYVSATGISGALYLFAGTALRWYLIGLTIALFLFAYRNIAALLVRLFHLARRMPGVRKFVDLLPEIPAMTHATLLRCFVLLGLFLTTEYVQIWVLLRGFCDAGLLDVAIAYAVILFIKFAVPFAAGDLGVREISSVYLFSQIGIPDGVALNAALIHFLSNNVLPALAGGWIFLHIRATERSSALSQSVPTPQSEL